MQTFLSILTLVALVGCGDNIKPEPRPDARIYYQPTEPDNGMATEPDGVNPSEPADAGVPPDACVDLKDHEWNGEGTGHENHCAP